MSELEKGQKIFIPYECPLTDVKYGLRKKPEKMKYLGTIQKISRIEGEKIVVGAGWFFHKDDLLVELKEPSKPEICLFNPENLMV